MDINNTLVDRRLIEKFEEDESRNTMVLRKFSDGYPGAQKDALLTNN